MSEAKKKEIYDKGYLHMNRTKKGVMPEITRETYKSVKKYDRQQFTVFCTNLYKDGYEDGRESVPGIDVADIMDAISGVKGIGAKKLESIKTAIESAYQAKERGK